MWYVVISPNSRKSVCLYASAPPINPKGVVGQVVPSGQVYVQVTRVLVWAYSLLGRVSKSEMGPWDEQQQAPSAATTTTTATITRTERERERQQRQKGCVLRASTCHPLGMAFVQPSSSKIMFAMPHVVMSLGVPFCACLSVCWFVVSAMLCHGLSVNFLDI